jgi:hypothetical protein
MRGREIRTHLAVAGFRNWMPWHIDILNIQIFQLRLLGLVVVVSAVSAVFVVARIKLLIVELTPTVGAS